MKEWRVWKCFKDSSKDIAVLVEAPTIQEARSKGMELLKDEIPFGGGEDEMPINYSAEEMG